MLNFIHKMENLNSWFPDESFSRSLKRKLENCLIYTNFLAFSCQFFRGNWTNGNITTKERTSIKSMTQEEEMEGGINLLLIITVVIGTTLMTSLIVCYVCVFRSLCCPSAEELERAHSMMRRGSSRRRFTRPSTLETNGSSQPTETERV